MPIYNLMIISVSNWPIFPASGDEVNNRILGSINGIIIVEVNRHNGGIICLNAPAPTTINAWHYTSSSSKRPDP
jgi:hypothetical protein